MTPQELIAELRRVPREVLVTRLDGLSVMLGPVASQAADALEAAQRDIARLTAQNLDYLSNRDGSVLRDAQSALARVTAELEQERARREAAERVIEEMADSHPECPTCQRVARAYFARYTKPEGGDDDAA